MGGYNHTKRGSAALTVREMHVESVTSCHLSPANMDPLRTTENSKCGKDVVKPEPCALLVGT